jgi:hypothetical protein
MMRQFLILALFVTLVAVSAEMDAYDRYFKDKKTDGLQVTVRFVQ